MSQRHLYSKPDSHIRFSTLPIGANIGSMLQVLWLKLGNVLLAWPFSGPTWAAMSKCLGHRLRSHFRPEKLCCFFFFKKSPWHFSDARLGNHVRICLLSFFPQQLINWFRETLSSSPESKYNASVTLRKCICSFYEPWKLFSTYLKFQQSFRKCPWVVHKCFLIFWKSIPGANLSPTIVLLQNSVVSCRVPDFPYFLVAHHARATDAQGKLPISQIFFIYCTLRALLILDVGLCTCYNQFSKIHFFPRQLLFWLLAKDSVEHLLGPEWSFLYPYTLQLEVLFPPHPHVQVSKAISSTPSPLVC